MMSFHEYVALREGLMLPDRPPVRGRPRLNTTPFTNKRRNTIFRPRKVRVARTPRVRKATVPSVPKVPLV
jgi:hypothetical protein